MRRKILITTAALLLLLLLAFLFRRPLLAPILRSELREGLAQALDADVTVGEIGGNLLDRVEVSGIQVTGKPGGAVTRLRDGRVQVDFRLAGLLAGQADAIRRITVQCRELVLDAAGTLPPRGGSLNSEWTSGAIHALLPEGARVCVDSLALCHGGHERRAPLEATLSPLATIREVAVQHGASHLRVRASSGATRLEGSIEVPDTGGLFRACGFDNDLRGGLLSASFALGPEALQVPEVVVTVPGLRLHGAEWNVPFRDDAIGRATGRVALEVVDIGRQVAQWDLPPGLRELLPTRGQVRAHVADGKLVVADGELVGKGLSVQIRRGELSLARELRHVSGAIGFTVSATSPVVLPFPQGREVHVQGRLHCQVTGSVAEPRLHAEALIEEMRYQDLALRSGDAVVDLGGDNVTAVLRQAELRADGEALGAITCRGRGGAELAGARTLSADLQGELDLRWFRCLGLVPPRSGVVGFRISGRGTLPSAGPVGDLRLQVPDLRLAGGGRWQLSLGVRRGADGSLGLPELSLAGNGSLRLQAQRHPNGRVDGDVRFSELGIQDLAALVGLDLHGSVSGTAAGKDLLGSPEGTVDLVASRLGLLAVLPPVLAAQLPRGPWQLRVAGQVGARGCQVAALGVKAEDRGYDGKDGLEVEGEMQGYLPLSWTPGGPAVVPAAARPDAPWLHGRAWGRVRDPILKGGQLRHEVALALGEDGLRIQKLVVSSQAGAVAVEGNMGLHAESLASLPWNLGQVPLDLVVNLERFRLERLPARWTDPFSVAGLVSGRLLVLGPAAKPLVRGTLQGNELRVGHPQGPALQSGELHLALEPNAISVEQLTAKVGETRLQVTGRVDVEADHFWQALGRPETPLAGEFHLQDVPLVLLPPARAGLEEVGGLLSGRLEVTGTIAEPQPKLQLSLRKGAARGAGRPAVQDVAIDVAVTGREVKVSRCSGTVGAAPFAVTAQLESPAVSPWQLPSRPDAPLRASARIEGLTMDALPRAWTGLDDLRGRITGSLRLEGSLQRPQPEGNVQVTGASVKPPRLPRLDEVNATLELSRGGATLEVTGTLGAGPLRLEARVDAGQRLLVEADRTGKVTASLVGRDLLLARAPGMRVRADVNLAVAGNPEEMTVGGRIDITSAKLRRRLSLLPDPRLQGGTALSGIGPLAIGPPLGERLRFRVDIATKNPAIVRTHVFDADLDAALQLMGPGNALQLQGAVTSRSGVLRFPGSSMRLESCRVIFDPRTPDRPELVVNAAGRRYGFETRLQAKGRPGDIEVEMSSVPPLSAKEVMVLITTGVPPDRLASRETRANVGLVGSYVLSELIGSFFASESLEATESFAERFTFEFGKEVSRSGEETWSVEYDLSHVGLRNFAARVEQDVYEDQSINLIYKMRF